MFCSGNIDLTFFVFNGAVQNVGNKVPLKVSSIHVLGQVAYASYCLTSVLDEILCFLLFFNYFLFSEIFAETKGKTTFVH